jgi:hypothetical protein
VFVQSVSLLRVDGLSTSVQAAPNVEATLSTKVAASSKKGATKEGAEDKSATGTASAAKEAQKEKKTSDASAAVSDRLVDQEETEAADASLFGIGRTAAQRVRLSICFSRYSACGTCSFTIIMSAWPL